MRIAFLVLLFGWLAAARADLRVTALGKEYRPDPARVAVAHPVPAERINGGNTSFRNEEPLRWKDDGNGAGYYMRNRDLGQVFTAPGDRPLRLDAIILRTGWGDQAVAAGAPGAPLVVQFFEVEGEPVIRDNGTAPGQRATHGFDTKYHRCDDWIEGVNYRSIHVARGGVFPEEIPPTSERSRAQPGALNYFRIGLAGESRIRLQPGKRYAFLVGFESGAPRRSVGLANRWGVFAPEPAGQPSADPRFADSYPGGWAIRREGDGTLPITITLGAEPPGDPALRAKHERESRFPEDDKRFAVPPGTDGYPDVCTYRDYEFYLEASPAE